MVRCGGSGYSASAVLCLRVAASPAPDRFGAVTVLTWRAGLIGLALAPRRGRRAWTGKKVLDRLPVDMVVELVEIGLVLSGVLLLITGG